jgi:hypothetical protein
MSKHAIHNLSVSVQFCTGFLMCGGTAGTVENRPFLFRAFVVAGLQTGAVLAGREGGLVFVFAGCTEVSASLPKSESNFQSLPLRDP